MCSFTFPCAYSMWQLLSLPAAGTGFGIAHSLAQFIRGWVCDIRHGLTAYPAAAASATSHLQALGSALPTALRSSSMTCSISSPSRTATSAESETAKQHRTQAAKQCIAVQRSAMGSLGQQCMGSAAQQKPFRIATSADTRDSSTAPHCASNMRLVNAAAATAAQSRQLQCVPAESAVGSSTERAGSFRFCAAVIVYHAVGAAG